jgi:hypothetical protein
MVSVLKLDAMQTPSGQQIMSFGAGGLVDFDGSYQPSGFNFPSWEGAGGRPVAPVVGTMGINSGIPGNPMIEVYLGLNAITNQPSWLMISGEDAPEA